MQSLRNEIESELAPSDLQRFSSTRLVPSVVSGEKPQFIQFHPSGAIIVQHDGYEIVYVNPITNALVAVEESAPIVVSLSGGLGSGVAGERAIKRYDRQNVAFWFADTLSEDLDLYRYLHDLMRRWGGRLYWFCSGKRPKDIWQKHRIIGNNRMCPCSMELKVRWFRQFIKAMPHLPRVIIGFKPKETDRMARTCGSYEDAIPGCQVEYPLLWEPEEDRDLLDVSWEEMGIAPPLLYWLGFAYNNCSGGCCRAGLGGRVLEAVCFPAQYEKESEWEELQRACGGSLAGRAFCRRQKGGVKNPISLAQIREEYVPLAEAYFREHPHEPVSEKNLVRVVKRWHRQKSRHEKMGEFGDESDKNLF